MEKKKLYKRPWFIILLIVVFILLILVSPVLYALYGFWFVPEVLQWHKRIKYQEYEEQLHSVVAYVEENISDQTRHCLTVEKDEMDGYYFYDNENNLIFTLPQNVSQAVIELCEKKPSLFSSGCALYLSFIICEEDGTILFCTDQNYTQGLVYSPVGKPRLNTNVKIKEADENWYYIQNKNFRYTR